MLSGDNGILQKATDAKTLSGKANVIEQAKTDILGQIAENKGENISKEQLKSILNTYFDDIDNLVLPDDLSNSDIKLNANQQNGGYKDIALVDIYNGILVQGDTKTDLAKLTSIFKNKDEAELNDILSSDNNYEIITITDYDENYIKYYYIKYNGIRYKITVIDGDEYSFVDSVEEYKETLKDVTYAITQNNGLIQKGGSINIRKCIENMYELEDMEYISNNENIATIDSSGIIRGISGGEATITLKGVKTGKTKEINVSVMDMGL